MSLVASSISGAAYVLGNNEDKDTGNGFEFTRRKRWPQLLLSELSGAALFCIKPILERQDRGSVGSADGKPAQKWTWKIIFVSPSVGDMLGQKAQELEGRDFLDLVYGADQTQIQNVFTSLLTPSLSHHASSNTSTSTQSAPSMPQSTSTKSHTSYIRMTVGSEPNSQSSSSRPGSSRGSGSSNNGNGTSANGRGTIVWEVRAHATGVEGVDTVPAGFGLGGAGTMVPQGGGEEMKGKAIWVMGRRVGEGVGDGDGNGNGSGTGTVNGNGNGGSNGQSLDAFLELKLENEKLREELKELQLDLDDYDDFTRTPYNIDPSPSRPAYHPSQSSANSSSSDSRSSSPAASASSPNYPAPKNKPGRPSKGDATAGGSGSREKKRKKSNVALSSSRATGNGGEGEGMHVCVTCGRTDSPEWRKGPLGPKTLCNACGLRWAKRNSTAPSRKDRKITGNK